MSNGDEAADDEFTIGVHIRWNSETWQVSGKIITIPTRDTECKGHPRDYAAADPRYEIKSDKTEQVAIYNGAALHRIGFHFIDGQN